MVGDMAADRDPVELRLAPDLDPPALTPAAAGVLLRILRKAHDRHLGPIPVEHLTMTRP
jgi:hypothetical protein